MHFGWPHRGFGISPPVWVKNKRKSKLKNRIYYWANLKQNSKRNQTFQVKLPLLLLKWFILSDIISKSIGAFLFVFNFYELYIWFCIKDIQTAYSPPSGTLVKSGIKHSIQKPILLNLVNLITTPCLGLRPGFPTLSPLPHASMPPEVRERVHREQMG